MNMNDSDVYSSVFANSDLLHDILSYAASNSKDVPALAATCRQWNDILNVNIETSCSIWRNICANQEPELIRVYDLCRESKTAHSTGGGGWKILLRRYVTSTFQPAGINKGLQKILKLVFDEEGILPFRNFCGYCLYRIDYRNSCMPWAPPGIYRFDVFIDAEELVHSVDVEFHESNFNYILENWDDEYDKVRRWCAVLGVTEFTVEMPEVPLRRTPSEMPCFRVYFERPVELEKIDFEVIDYSELNYCEVCRRGLR